MNHTNLTRHNTEIAANSTQRTSPIPDPYKGRLIESIQFPYRVYALTPRRECSQIVYGLSPLRFIIEKCTRYGVAVSAIAIWADITPRFENTELCVGTVLHSVNPGFLNIGVCFDQVWSWIIRDGLNYLWKLHACLLQLFRSVFIVFDQMTINKIDQFLDLHILQ